MRRGVLFGLFLLAGCTTSQATPLPGGPATEAATTAAPTTAAVRTPPPRDGEAAVPDTDAGRTASSAQGTVAVTVRGPVPGGAAGQAYLGWVRASLTAFARPGAEDGGLDSYAAPAVAKDVRDRVGQLVLRGWAEYGTASVSGVEVRVSGDAAAVSACLDLSGLATRDATGRLAGRDRPVRSVATLALTSGRWLVTADRRTSLQRCA